MRLTWRNAAPTIGGFCRVKMAQPEKMKSRNATFHRRHGLAILLLALAPLAAAQSQSTLTIAEGKVLLLRGTATYAVAPGVKFETGDMLATEAKGQAQMEFADGLILNLGPDSKLYLQDLSRAGGKATDVALAAGWLKIASPAAKGGLRALLPGLAIETGDATLVVHAAPGLDEAFVESGAVKTTEIARDGTPGKSLAANAGDYLSSKAGAGLASSRPPPAFLAGLPRHYKDKLPAFIARVKDSKGEPAREHDTSFAEVEAWLKAGAPVRKGLFARYQPRLKDAEFKSAVVANLADLPEWERAAGGSRKK